MRKAIYSVLEHEMGENPARKYYDIIMLVAISASIFPLMFAYERPYFHVIEQVTVVLFIIDYLLRWATADFRLKKGFWSFLLYPFTPWAIIDLLSILPALTVIGKGYNGFPGVHLLYDILRAAFRNTCPALQRGDVDFMTDRL